MGSCRIGVIDYGNAGNIHNILRALGRAGSTAGIVRSSKDFTQYDKFILPGVGSFSDAMREIDRSGIREELLEQFESKSVLGICVGMQILATIGYEYGVTSGLNLIKGRVVRLPTDGILPHIGFNKIVEVGESEILKGVTSFDEFYFMHSYELSTYSGVTAVSEYCGLEFVAAVAKGNIFGVQFHPEKSRESGIKVLRNFINY